MIVRARPPLDYNRLFSILEGSHSHEGIAELANRFSEAAGVDSAVMTHQGRDALAMIFSWIHLNSGDEVILPNLICRIVVEIVLQFNAIPVIADTEMNGINIDPDDVARKITPKTRAILAPHLYGMPCDIQKLRDIADSRRLILIEDCAQSLQSSAAGRPVGTFGDFSVFSMNFDKPFTTGLGGALVVNHPEFKENIQEFSETVDETEEKQILEILLIQHYCTDPNHYRSFLPIGFGAELYQIPGVQKLVRKAVRNRDAEVLHPLIPAGRFYRDWFKLRRHLFRGEQRDGCIKPRLMGPVRAAMGCAQLEALEEVIMIRNRHAEKYSKFMRSNSRLRLPDPGKDHHVNYLRYTVRVESEKLRNQYIRTAHKIGIEADNNNWPYLISQLKQLTRIRADRATLKNSLSLIGRLMHLPVHHDIHEEAIQKLAGVFNKI